MTDTSPVHILIADDDLDDCLLTREAFAECKVANPLHFVHNGEELLNYLKHCPPYTDDKQHPSPGLILLDLNMPLMDGREALQAIKANKHLRSIPIIILTTSSAEEDIANSYQFGGVSFITKPVSFSGLLKVVKTLSHYWLEVVKLPLKRNHV